jgi:hypothetical protein
VKRHPSIRKFSDDHHRGLVQARRLRRAAAGEGEPPAEAARAFLRFWEEDTSLHLRDEEEVLLAVYARHGGDPCAGPILLPACMAQPWNDILPASIGLVANLSHLRDESPTTRSMIADLGIQRPSRRARLFSSR